MANFSFLAGVRARIVSALALILVVWSPPSWAIDSASRGAARQLGYEGVEAYQKQDYGNAVDKLERAYKVLRVPSLALWSARALWKSGKWVEASERYLEGTRLVIDEGGDPKVQERAKEEAREEREALLERIPRVIVRIEGADPEQVEVTIDGVAVNSALFGAGRPTNPGDIEVVAQWGQRTVKGTVSVAEGEEKSITLAFKDQPPPAIAPTTPADSADSADSAQAASDQSRGAATQPRDQTARAWQRPVGWGTFGLGVAGLSVGAVTGFIALLDHFSLQGSCDSDRVCAGSDESLVNTYNTMRTVSGASLIAGGVLTAAGLTLVLTAPRHANSATLTPYLSFASAGVRGRF